MASDRGLVSILVLLDVSAAFDTIDQNILLERLQHEIKITGTALDWFKSYLMIYYLIFPLSAQRSIMDPILM